MQASLFSSHDLTVPYFSDVCVRFAKNQPAPRGNLAVHCGGPGTLSSCVYDFDVDLGTDNIGTLILLSECTSSIYRNRAQIVVCWHFTNLKTIITLLGLIR